MTDMIGANPEQLLALGTAMQRASERLGAIRDSLDSLFRHEGWNGGDAEEFRRLWAYPLSGRLHTAVEVTQAAANTLRTNANQQIEVSRDDGSHGGASGGDRKEKEHENIVEKIAEDVWKGVGVGFFAKELLDVARDSSRANWLVKAGKSIGANKWVKPVTDVMEHDLDRPEVLTKLEDSEKFQKFEKFDTVGKLDHVGLFAVANVGIDGGQLAWRMAHGEWDTKTMALGISTALDVAGIALAATPAGLVVDSVALGWALMPDSWHTAIEHGVATAAVDVYHGATTLATDYVKANIALAKDEIHVTEQVASAAVHVTEQAAAAAVQTTEKVAGAVGSIASGGVNAAKHFFHL